MKNKKIITLCSSASFYKEVLEVAEKLRKLGFEVKYPSTADKMRQTGDYKIETYKTWFNNDNDWKRKTKLMNDHIKKVVGADCILMINDQKNGLEGYIGGNGLIEMAIAFYLKKPIYIYRSVSTKSPLYEEIKGMNPIIINQDLSRIPILKIK